MAARNPSIAKLTPPVLPRIVERSRLFSSLRQARKLPAVWLTGPAGCGKTTLIASYIRGAKAPVLWYQLDAGDAAPATFFHYVDMAVRRNGRRRGAPLPRYAPEHLANLTVFARRFFEAVFMRLGESSILVLDNYQDVAEPAAFHEVVRGAVAAAPAGSNVIALSRRAPPRALARLRGQGSISVINEEALRLTPNELERLAKLRLGARRAPPRHELEQLHRRTRGWMAGAVLSLERRVPGAHADDPRGQPSDALFDYLASEVLSRLDRDTQTVLLKTAVLPQMSASMASALSGVPRAGEVLAQLHRDRYFTELRPGANPIYQYHPLFREFLLAQSARRFAARTLRRLRNTAAHLAEEAGLLEDAGALYRHAEQFHELARLVLAHAARLLGDGRVSVLEHWLDGLPAALVEETPWLQFWRAACRLAVNPAEAKQRYVQAFAQFHEGDDLAGALLAWCGIVDAIWYEWVDLPAIDSWIDRFGDLMPAGKQYPSPAIEAAVACAMFNALFWRRPVHAVIEPWARNARRVLETTPAFSAQHSVTAIALINYYVQVGAMADAERILDLMNTALRRGATSPVLEAGRYQAEAVLAAVLGDTGRCEQAVTTGLAHARDGAPLWTVPLAGAGCLCALSIADWSTAKRYSDQMLAHFRDGALVFRSWALTLQARLEFSAGDLRNARRTAESSLQLTVREGPFPEFLSRLGLVHALHAAGRTAEAVAHLDSNAAIARDLKSGLFEIGWRMAAAQIAFDERREQEGLAHLTAGLAAGACMGIVEWQDGFRPRDLARLCARALEAGIERDYVQTLIRKRRLPAQPEWSPPEWPWPIKVYALGRFAVTRDERPMAFTGKAQKRPLELLKALLALGGRAVGEARLIEALWPDAEGDAAYAALTMALKRLRALLGRHDALLLAERKLTLNAAVCWVDIWAFERQLGKQDSAERALDLYRGAFLAGDNAPWALSQRERLRAKFLTQATAAGNKLEREGNLQDAVEHYRRALDIDDLAEELYQRLMVCHGQLGQRAEAVSTYKRCAAVLKTHLGLAPSRETAEIYRRIAS